MCTPAVVAVSSVVGTGLAAYGYYNQGQTAKRMANWNVAVGKVKQADALSTGVIAEQQQRAKVRQIEGAQTAAMGASGTVIGEGTNADILDQTATYGELDAQTVRSNAWKAAWGLETQVRADNLQGELAADTGRNRAWTSLISATPDIYRAGKAADWWK